MRSASPASESSRIHEATRATDGSGAVYKGAELDETAAIARRRAGLDVVVCGDDLRKNYSLAKDVEAAVGVWKQQMPHQQQAGALALPHFQQANVMQAGHTFYETEHRKARRKP